MFWIFYWDSVVWVLWAFWIVLITLVWLNSYTNSSCGSRTIWEGSLNYTSTLTSRVSIRLSYPLMLGSVWETSWFAI